MDDNLNAQVGELVECINALPSAPGGPPPPFKKGELYKVEALGLTQGNKRPAYKLESIPEFWTRTRFRRLPPEKKTKDQWVEQFKQLTQPNGTPVKTPEFEDA